MIHGCLPLSLFQISHHRENHIPVVPNRFFEFLISIGALFQSEKIILNPFRGRVPFRQSGGIEFLPDSRNLRKPRVGLLLHEREIETD